MDGDTLGFKKVAELVVGRRKMPRTADNDNVGL